MSRWPDRTLEERFMDKVEKTDGCWLWTAYRNNKGYGVIRVDGRSEIASRIAYLIFKGDPGDMHVLHTCDGGPDGCVRPEHLWLGTHLDSMRDRDQKGRQARGESNGQAKLTELDIRGIRRAAGGKSLRDLGRQYGVHHSIILGIKKGKRWSHV